MISQNIYNRSSPRVVSNSNLVLVHDQNHDMLGMWKFKPMWCGPSMVFHMIPTRGHDFIDYDRNPLSEPCNGIYLNYYA
jgi:hypothetical protein